MGVQLTQLVEGQQIELDALFEKIIAVDAFNWIYQFLSIIRQPDGTPLKDSKGRTTSHLSGLFYRSLKLMEAGINLCYVFDGKPPELKAVIEKRRDMRAEAMREWKKALKEEDYEAARKYAMRSSTITDDIVEGSKQLLDAMGIPWVQAPSEGEALCAYMCKNGDAHAVATQDYDSLLFGAPRVVRNLSISSRRSGEKALPELLVLENVLKNLGLNQDQLIAIAIIIGTDYNPGGVPGYGPKKAIELVSEKKKTEKIFSELIWDFNVQPEEIMDFFKNPPVCEYKLMWRDMDEEKIKKIMCDDHDFSEERIENAIKKFREAKSSQKSLGRWVKK